MDSNKIALIAMLISAIIITVQIVIELKAFNKNAMHWWNSLSIYGKSILIEKYLKGLYQYSYEVPKKDILYLYKLHLKRKINQTN